MKTKANVRYFGFSLLVTLAMVVAPGLAQAETLFTAVLSGSQEVPETASPATGFATVILNDAETEATYHIEYSGLAGTETAAHFHQAPIGTNGPAIFALPVGSPKDGVWPVGPAEVAALNSHEVYINIHSDMYPGGEIRGNVCFSAVDTEKKSWGNIKALYRR